MKIPISKRLLACCSYVENGERIADIGTDHGYLGIWLLKNNIAKSVIAADIVPGPLSSARKNADKCGCAEQMEFYLSDGVQSIPRDFDTLVCAGMGADTMISILSAAPWLCNDKYKIILQCQSKTPMLRRFLSETGFQICQETILRDGRFLYTVMKVKYSPGHSLTPGQWYFPPALMACPTEELPQYFKRVLYSLQRAINGKKETDCKDLENALMELRAFSAKKENRFLLEDNG